MRRMIRSGHPRRWHDGAMPDAAVAPDPDTREELAALVESTAYTRDPYPILARCRAEAPSLDEHGSGHLAACFKAGMAA